MKEQINSIDNDENIVPNAWMSEVGLNGGLTVSSEHLPKLVDMPLHEQCIYGGFERLIDH